MQCTSILILRRLVTMKIWHMVGSKIFRALPIIYNRRSHTLCKFMNKIFVDLWSFVFKQFIKRRKMIKIVCITASARKFCCRLLKKRAKIISLSFKGTVAIFADLSKKSSNQFFGSIIKINYLYSRQQNYSYTSSNSCQKSFIEWSFIK